MNGICNRTTKHTSIAQRVHGLANQGDSQYPSVVPDDGTFKCTEIRQARILTTYITESVSKVGVIYCVSYFTYSVVLEYEYRTCGL